MSFRSFIRHNFWLKLFSLMLATLIWFTVVYWRDNDFRLSQAFSSSPLAPRVFSRLPLSVLTRPGDGKVYRLFPAEVTVTVAGDQAVLDDLVKKDIRAYVDLSNVGHLDVSSQLVKLHIPLSGVIPVKVVPPVVRVEEMIP
jgi:YbbR domain-containing protein